MNASADRNNAKKPKKEIVVTLAVLLSLSLLAVLLFCAGRRGISAPTQPDTSTAAVGGQTASSSSFPDTASSPSAAQTEPSRLSSVVSAVSASSTAVRTGTTTSSRAAVSRKTAAGRTTVPQTAKPPLTAEAREAVSREVRAEYADRIADREAAHKSAQAEYTRRLEEIALERYDREQRINEAYANNGQFGSDAHQAALDAARSYRQNDYDRILTERDQEQAEYEEWMERTEQAIQEKIAVLLARDYAAP